MKTPLSPSVSAPRVFLTQRQLADRWLCSEEKIKRMRRRGILPVHYIGRAARFKVADIERLEAESAA